MKSFLLSLVAVALVASAVDLDAHGIWFAQRPGELALIFGEGADDEATVHRLAGVRDLGAWDASGTKVATRLITADRLLLVDMHDVKPDRGVDADKIQHRATLSFVLPLED